MDYKLINAIHFHNLVYKVVQSFRFKKKKLFFLWPYLQHMEVPGLGVKSELHHGHSNAGSEMHLRPMMLQLAATPDL